MGFRFLNKTLLLFLLVFLLFSPLHSRKVSRRRADKTVFLSREDIVKYIGNAKFTEEGNQILSDYMQFHTKDDVGYCEGNVRMYNKEQTVLVRAGRLDYFGVSNLALVTINPVLYSDAENMTIRSIYMERDLKTEETRAISNVAIEKFDSQTGQRSYGFSDKMRYLVDENTAYLTGNPVLIHKGDVAFGEIIHYYVHEESLDIFGNAKIFFGGDSENKVYADRIYFLKTENDDAAEAYGNVRMYLPENDVVAYSGYALFNQKDEFMIMRNYPRCRFTDDDSEGSGREIRYTFAKGKEEISFHEDVFLVNKKDGSVIESGKLVSDIEKGYTKITEEPICYLEERSVRVRATFFERFENKDKLYAKGNVIVERIDFSAYSSLAVYDSKKNIIKMWGGNPRVVQKGKEMFAREIYFHPETGKAEFTDVSGSILQ